MSTQGTGTGSKVMPATSRTKTTATAVAVPMGDRNTTPSEVTAPRGLVIAIVVLNSIALFFCMLTFLFLPLAFVGLICAIIAAILACVLPCQESGDEFQRGIKRLMWTHIANGVTYSISIALGLTAFVTIFTGSFNAATGLGIAVYILFFVNLALLITCLVLASILLRKINAARNRPT